MALTGSSIASTYLKLLRINTDTMGADDTASYIQDSADTDSALSISTNRVGIGTATPDGAGLHIHSATAGSVTAHSAADELVVEGSGTTGISILTADDQTGAIMFGCPSDTQAARITNVKSTGIFTVGASQSSGVLHLQAGTGTTRMVLDDNSRISLSNNDGGNYNTVFGYGAGMPTGTNSNSNVIIGHETFDLVANDGATGNTFVGYRVARGNPDSSTDHNVGIGYAALNVLTSGDSNVCIGSGAGVAITEEHNVIAIGRNAGAAIEDTGADGTVAIGRDALGALTDGSGNIAIGYNALSQHTTGARNIAIGYGAMDETAGNVDDAPDSDHNVFIGHDSGGGNWVDSSPNHYNVAVGSYTMDAILNGAWYNTTIGYNAGSEITQGDYNTLIGAEAGDAITIGGKNTIVGYTANPSAVSSTNQIVIGYDATGVADNSVTLGDANVTAVYMNQDGGATVYGGKPQWSDSSKKYYKLISSVALTGDALTDWLTVGHTHSYNITFWADSVADGVTGFHRTSAVYGSGNTSELHEQTYGSGTDNITIAYNNSGYKLQITAASADCTLYYMIEGFGSEALATL